MTNGGSAAPEPPDDQDNRNVKIAVMAGVIVVLVVVAGTWLLNAMIDIQKAQDCAAERRRNCAEIEVPDRAR